MIIMKNFEKTNNFKNELVDHLVSLLDDLENGTIHSICSSFIISPNSKIKDEKLALKEICDLNSDIRGRVDVFDHLNFDKETIIVGHPPVKWPVKGITITLFLDKDKDRFDHPDINRFYAHYPEFYTGLF